MTQLNPLLRHAVSEKSKVPRPKASGALAPDELIDLLNLVIAAYGLLDLVDDQSLISELVQVLVWHKKRLAIGKQLEKE